MPDESATLAINLLAELTAGVDFSVPAVDLSDPDYQIPASDGLDDPLTKLTNADLTTGAVGGTGTFDLLMKSLGAHIQDQFEKNRLSGDQFAKAYVELTAAAMQNAVQFLIQRDSSYWQAVAAQQQALAAQIAVVIAKVQLQTEKVRLQALSYEMNKNKAEFALTEMKLATESISYDTGKFSLDNILPAQKNLVVEQTEAQHAQTLDVRMDGVTPVTGLIGKQKALYDQQITSYKRDAEIKGIKIFTDAWITQKTIDEGLLPPTKFANANLDTILTTLQTNLALG